MFNKIKSKPIFNRVTGKLLKTQWLHRNRGHFQSMLVYGISDTSEAYLNRKQQMI